MTIMSRQPNFALQSRRITDDEETLSALRHWGVETMIKFQKAIESKAEEAQCEVMGVL
jgi:hypothetical protein